MKKSHTNSLIGKMFRKTICFFMALIFMFSVFATQSMNVFAATLKTSKITSLTSVSATSMKIKWKKVSGASGYVLYQKKEDGSYKKIKTIKEGDNTSFVKKGLKSATEYSYMVQAYKLKNGKKIYSSKSNAESAYTKPSTPKITSIKLTKKTKAEIKWKKVKKVDGYIIYCSSGKKYKKIATIKSGKKTSYTVKGLDDCKQYTFAICSYVKENKKKIYSAKSEGCTLNTHNYLEKVIDKSTFSKACSLCNIFEEVKIPEIAVSVKHTGTSSATMNGFGSFSKYYEVTATGGYGALQYKFEVYTNTIDAEPNSELTKEFSKDNTYGISYWGFEDAIDEYVMKVYVKDIVGNQSMYLYEF